MMITLTDLTRVADCLRAATAESYFIIFQALSQDKSDFMIHLLPDSFFRDKIPISGQQF